jgi:hypothetical protein
MPAVIVLAAEFRRVHRLIRPFLATGVLGGIARRDAPGRPA